MGLGYFVITSGISRHKAAVEADGRCVGVNPYFCGHAKNELAAVVQSPADRLRICRPRQTDDRKGSRS